MAILRAFMDFFAIFMAFIAFMDFIAIFIAMIEELLFDRGSYDARK